MYTTQYDIEHFGKDEAQDVARFMRFLKSSKNTVMDRMVKDWYPSMTAAHNDAWIINVTGGTGSLELKYRDKDFRDLYFDIEKEGKVDVYVNFICGQRKVVIFPISRIDITKLKTVDTYPSNNTPLRKEKKYLLPQELGWVFTWNREKHTYDVKEPNWTLLNPKPYRAEDVDYDPQLWEATRNNGLQILQTYLDKTGIVYNLING